MSNYSSGPTYYARESNLMYAVFAWMSLALGITAITAYYVSITPAIFNFIFSSSLMPIVLFIIQIGLVLCLSALIQRLNLAAAAGLFILYAVTLGITLSAIFRVFELPSIFATFLVSAGMFGAMALYGYFTRADLTSLGSIGFMALIGLIIGGLVNMWLKSPGFNYVLSAIGVLVFTLLTAYDVQKIKNMMENMQQDHETMSKMALVGALTLYLDFINLFLYMLQFMGKRKD